MRPTAPVPRAATAIVFVVAALALAGCGGDAAADDGTVVVTLDDFRFVGLPDEVPAGTRLDVRNVADRELHELVAVRLPDGDGRPLAEIVDHIGEVFAAGPPAAVLLAAPGGPPIAAVGDGTLTEPGRYLVVCTIPTGVDPDTYLEAAAASDGPPDVSGGAPHLAHGMFAELIVTDA